MISRLINLPAEPPAASSTPHPARCSWFWAWATIGAVGTLGLVSLGPIALTPAVIAGAVLSKHHTARQAGPGVLTGAGSVFLYIAYLQRHGPGPTCWHTRTATGCGQNLNPIPWLIIGVLLLAAGVLQHTRRTV